MLKLFWGLFGVVSEDAFSCTQTEFALLSIFSSTTSIPIVFDEYKPWDLSPQDLKRFTRIVRRAYDGEVEFRGKPDLTLEPFTLSIPVAVAGEVPLSEGALLERIIPVNPSPNWLRNNPEARKAFKTLKGLPLNGFIDRYIRYALGLNFDEAFNEAQAVTTELIGQRELPGRVVDNILTVVFGFMQFERYGQKWGQEIPDSIDIAYAVNAIIDQICGSTGVTRTALDDLIEHLSVMAETGRLTKGVHYTIRPSDGCIALRLDACFAEFRRYARETNLHSEVLDKKAYDRQLKENKDNNSYVRGINIAVHFSASERKKAVLIDPGRAEDYGLDLSGFFLERVCEK